MSAVARSNRPSPLPAPGSFEIHVTQAGWEVRPDGGRALSRHAKLVDALSLASSLARRSGAEVRVYDGRGPVQRIPVR